MCTRNEIRLFAGAASFVFAVSIGCSTSPQAKEARFLKRGQVYLEKKNYARALLEFQNAASRMPKDAEPFYGIGIAYLKSGNIGLAVAALRHATDLNPKHTQAQMKLSEILTASRKQDLVEQAAKRLQDVLAASPGNVEASETLAVAESELGKSGDAIKDLEEILQKVPADLHVAVNLARLKLRQKDLQGAEEVIKKVAATAPQSPHAALALGQLYVVLGQPEKAEAEIQRALNLDPNNGAALMSLAAVQAGGHRLQEVEQTYKRLAALPDERYKPLHALFLYRTGKRDAALAEFQALAKSDPSNRTARSRLVAVYFEMGKISDAQSLLAAALKKNPKDTDALFQRSQLYLQSGKVDEAIQDLTQVLHFKPDSANAHLALAILDDTKGQKESKQSELNEALRLNPGLVSARVSLAATLTAAGHGTAALELLDKAPGTQKNSSVVVIERNWALWALGRTKELRANLDRQIKVARIPELLVQRALLRMKDGDYPSARADAEEVLGRNPQDLLAARLVADTFVLQREDAKAMAWIRDLAAAHPKSAPLQTLLAQWCFSAGDLAGAQKAFEAAKSADFKYLEADFGLAQVEYRRNNLDGATQRLTAILGTDPKNVPTLMLLAHIEEDAGDRESAIARYRQVLDADSSNTPALDNLAYDLAFDNPDEALKFAQRALDIAPDSAAAADTLGWIYYRKGIYSTALNYLKAAVAKGPTPSRQFHLAMSYLKSGDRELGQQMLAAALKKDPALPKKEQGW
jgi:tetratricopeptide (TPR) repeat protein